MSNFSKIPIFSSALTELTVSSLFKLNVHFSKRPVCIFTAMYRYAFKVKVLVVQSSPTTGNLMDCIPRLLCPRDSSGKNTGVGCHFLLQGMFWTQGLNLHLLHWQTDSLPLSHLGSPYVFGQTH